MSINTFLIQTNIFLIWFQEIHLEFEKYISSFGQIHLTILKNAFFNVDKYIYKIEQIHCLFYTNTQGAAPMSTQGATLSRPRRLRIPVSAAACSLLVVARALPTVSWLLPPLLINWPELPHTAPTTQSYDLRLLSKLRLGDNNKKHRYGTGSPRPLVTSSWEYSDKARTVTRVMAVPKMHSVMVTVMVFYAVDPSIATVFANANPLARSQCATRQALSSYQLSSRLISCFWCNVPSPKSVNMILSRKGHACTTSISIIILSLSKYYLLISVQWPIYHFNSWPAGLLFTHSCLVLSKVVMIVQWPVEII